MSMFQELRGKPRSEHGRRRRSSREEKEFLENVSEDLEEPNNKEAAGSEPSRKVSSPAMPKIKASLAAEIDPVPEIEPDTEEASAPAPAAVFASAPEVSAAPVQEAAPAPEPVPVPESESEPNPAAPVSEAAPAQTEETAESAEAVPPQTNTPPENNTPVSAAPGITAEQLSGIIAEMNKPIEEEIKSIHSMLNDISTRVSSLRKLADMHEEVETNMNKQINEYKENLYRRIVNPILVEFFDIQEDMAGDVIGISPDAADLINDYIDMMTNVFKHYGVSVTMINEGDPYDPSIHKPVKAIPTDEKEKDRTVAKTRKRVVHAIDGKVEERAPVQIYQYREQPAQETNPAAT